MAQIKNKNNVHSSIYYYNQFIDNNIKYYIIIFNFCIYKIRYNILQSLTLCYFS